jgi:deoxyribonuclease-1-like protein
LSTRKKSTTTRNKKRQYKSSRSRRPSNTWASWLLKVLLLLMLFLLADYVWHNWRNISRIIQQMGRDESSPSQPDSTATHTANNNTPQTPASPKPTHNETANKPSSLKIVSWNVKDMGASKTDAEIDFIAQILKTYDIVAMQEVSVDYAGARAVARLSDQLNRQGNKWSYALSNPTSGEGSERYAYMWKSNKVSLYKKVWLANEQNMAQLIDREPALACFKMQDQYLTIANFHAVPTTKKPQREIELIHQLHSTYTKDNLLIAGDFNLSQKDPAFDKLKKSGYVPLLLDQKTSLRRTTDPQGSYLSQPYDNIWIENAQFTCLKSGINDFVPKLPNLKAANQISDHLPVWCELVLKR